MNNGFYILPNEEGYLVKSYNNDIEIALFRSIRDAEVFISTLTLSPPPAFSINYSSGTSIPQYSSQPQQIIAPYPFYPMMPPTLQTGGMCNCIYPNYYGPQNNPYGPLDCTCGHNNLDYNEHFEINPHVKNNEGLKPGWNNVSNDLKIKKNNQLKDDTVPLTQKNDEYSNNGHEEQLFQSQSEEYNPQTVINQEGQNNLVATDEILGRHYNDVQVTNPESVITPNIYSEELQQQWNYSQQNNNQPYHDHEQAFFSNPGFLNQQSEQYYRPKQVAKPINVADDELFNFANEQEFNNNSKISKKETKLLMKEKLKASKMQAKLEKQNLKKVKRKGALYI